MNVVEAGRKGGLTVLRKLGREFYVGIGKRGQKSMRRKYPNMAREWGKLGGRPKKATLMIWGSEQILNKGRNGPARIFMSTPPPAL